MKVIDQRFTTVRVTEVQPHPKNPNVGDTNAITASMEANDFFGAILVQAGTGNILIGSHRWQVARTGGIEELPAFVVDVDEDRARRIMLADNATGRAAVWNEPALIDLLKDMSADAERGLAGSGFTDAAFMRLVTALTQKQGGGPTLADQFLVAPFDVLDGRRGWWLERRRQWLAIGIKSELGRFGGEGRAAYAGGWRRGDAQTHGTRKLQKELLGRRLSREEITEDGAIPDVSVFDPVLCELAYRWFSPPGGAVLDPFAGGSVRGLVAGLLGRSYHGNDLAARQVAANVEQAAAILPRAKAPGAVRWDTGDSAAWAPQLPADSYDLIFTCPPYYDTEVYTDHPDDLSGMSAGGFDEAYFRIMAGVGQALRPDRFAVIVTGDSRGKNGCLRDLRGATIRAMEAAGLGYCSGAVHVTPVWSLASTASRQFKGRRTLGRMHEDVLVFCRGNASKAARACGAIEVAFPEMPAPGSAGQAAAG